LSLIVVTPEQFESAGPRDLSQRIIQALTKPDIVDVVGIGTSISGVVAAVNLSSAIANVNIQSATLDYIPITVIGKQEAIFFELSREEASVALIVSEFESQEEGNKILQTIWVSREDRIENVTNLILWKLSKNRLIKVVASGFAITMAVRSTLQVTTSGITKEPVSISAITIEAIERRAMPSKKVPAIQIYLEKGKETVYSPRHKEVIEKVTAR
jgi:hypothetical protein